MGAIICYIWRLLISFFKFLWHMIISFKTAKGIIALTISFMLTEGWAVVLIIVGSIAKNYKIVGFATTWAVFWMAPLTPLFIIMGAIAYFIQRVILRDKKALKWADLKIILKKSYKSNDKSNEEVNMHE